MIELKIENSIHTSGLFLYSKDITGVYSVSNTGGWGTPNIDRKDIALMAIIEKYKFETDTVMLTPVTAQIEYDTEFANDYQSDFKFNVGLDGGHKHHLLILNPSDDGNYYLTGLPIETNDYFYLTTDELVYQKQDDGTNREVTDYKELIDTENGGRPQEIAVDQFWTPALSIKQAELYADYRVARMNCSDELKELGKVVELNLNLEHASGLFYMGLYMDAENVIETQLDLFDLN